MAYFDYDMPQNQGSGLGALVGLGVKGYLTYKDRKRQEELDAIAKQKAITDEHRQAASQKFMEDQARAVNTRQQQSQDQQNITFQQQQAKARGETATGIGKLFGPGRFGEAQAYAGAQQFMNPKTGKMEGVGLRRLPNEMPAPGEAPTAPQAPEFVGPLETPEMANARAPTGPVTDLIDPGTEVQRQQDLRDKFGADTASLPQRQAEHAKATTAFQEGERNPGFELSFPSGEKVTMAGREQKLAAQADAKQQAQELLRSFGPNTPPDVLRAVAIQAGLIGAGVSNADKAPISNSGAAMQAQEGRVVITDKNNKAALERAKAKAVGKGLGASQAAGLPELIKMKEDGAADSAIAARAAELRISPKVWTGPVKEVKRGENAAGRLDFKDVESWKKENGVDAIAKQQRELEGLQKEIADNPHNPLLQALAIEKAVSAARGGAASKQALALALEHLGGTLDNSGAVISKIKSGEIGPKQMENFTGFIRGQLGNAQKEGKSAYDNYTKWVETQPPEKQKGLLAARSRVFSGLHGFGGQAEGAPAEPKKKSGGNHPLDALDSWLSEKGY